MKESKKNANEVLIFNDYINPKPLANGIITQIIATELSNYHSVNTISFNRFKEGSNKLNFTKYKSYKINPFFTDKIYDYFLIERSIIFLKILNIFHSLFHMGFKKTKSFISRKRLIRSSMQLIDKYNIKAVIVIYKPSESLYLLKRIKKKYNSSVKTILYQVDSITDTSFHRIEWINKNIISEAVKIVKKYADEIVVMDYLKNDIDRFKLSLMRFSSIGLPYISNKDYSNRNTIPKTPIFVINGTFYKNIREPHKLLDYLVELSKARKYQIWIFTRGDFQKVFQNFAKLIKNALFFGYLSNSEYRKKIKNADIYLNVGNKNTYLIPSKIYEIINDQKPIIHFESSKNDYASEILDNYKFGLIIKYNQSIEDSVFATIKFLDFLKLKHNYSLDDYFKKNTVEANVHLLNKLLEV